jgi:hypothetical protein
LANFKPLFEMAAFFMPYPWHKAMLQLCDEARAYLLSMPRSQEATAKRNSSLCELYSCMESRILPQKRAAAGAATPSNYQKKVRCFDGKHRTLTSRATRIVRNLQKTLDDLRKSQALSR